METPAPLHIPDNHPAGLGDEHFLARFEASGFGPAEYGHREHLRTAWLYLRRDGAAQGLAAVRAGIRRLSAAHGAPDRYHETLTRAWFTLLKSAAAESFESLLCDHPELLDRRILLRYYSPGRLASEEARAGWVEPDLRPLDLS